MNTDSTTTLTEEQALKRLTAECAKREHCTGDMLEKLRRWHLDEAAQARIMQYLTAHQYVDDARYARLFIQDKMQFNQWGRRKIEQALWMKRVDKSIYAPLLDEIDENEWKALLLPLLRSKQRSVKAASDYERRMKLMRFGMSRGFDGETVMGCLDELEL